ncbi:unnamed protein product [Orchesella dallaii]|uniref:Cytochrome P450 n=1 Tax=Orchesella dallaii TaxID=48710 RepID=A0ABP1QKC1_9HEXA
MLPLIVGVIVCIIAGLYIYVRWNFGTLEKLGIPVVEHHPLLGSIKEIYGEPGGLYDTQWMRKYGPVFGVYEGREPQIYVCDADLIRLICVKDADHFNGKRILDFGDPLLNEMPDFQPLEKWKLLRQFLTPAFTTAKVKVMSVVMREATADYIANIKKTIRASNKRVYEKIPIDESVHTMLTDLITRCCFSIRISANSDADNEFAQIVKDVVNPPARTSNMALLHWSYVFTFLRKFVPAHFNPEAAQKWRKVFKQMIEERRRSGEKKNDIMDMCVEWMERLDAPKMKEAKFSEMTLICQGLVFFFAGQDQISTLIATTIYHIATNPEIAKKAYAEVDEVFAKHDGKLEHEHLTELVYLNACLSESLRLYPFFHKTERVCTKDWSNEEHGLHIKKGMTVILPVWAANRNAEYNVDPDTYDPERWMPENKDKMNPYTSTSFGFGPRSCTGKRFSTEAMPLVTAYMLKELKFVGRKDSELKFTAGGPMFAPHDAIYLDVMERTLEKVPSQMG